MVVVSEGDKSSIIFTIVELLLIALLLLCNCLNLVSVLGFGAHQVRSIGTSIDYLTASTTTALDFEDWQRAFLCGGSDDY